MRNAAPYASTPITVSLAAISGLRTRTLNCMECGSPFMERNSDMRLFRLNTKTMPEEARVDQKGQIAGLCGNCQQQYTVTVSVSVERNLSSIPLYMQPESIFIANTAQKSFRDIFCFECGKTFFSISDRIEAFVDDIVPLDLIAPDKLGPLEPRCKFNYCKQRYHIRV
jgi:hypothetical protein